MSSTITFNEPLDFFHNLVVIGTKKRITEQMGKIFEEIKGIEKTEKEIELQKEIIKDIKEDELTGGELQTTIGTTKEEEEKGGGKYKKISYLILPEIASRHNGRTRSEVIYESKSHLISWKKGGEGTRTQVVFIIDDRNDEKEEERDQLSFSAAISRTLPLFTRKSSSADNNNNNNNNNNIINNNINLDNLNNISLESLKSNNIDIQNNDQQNAQLPWPSVVKPTPSSLHVNCSFFHTSRGFSFSHPDHRQQLFHRYSVISTSIRSTAAIVDTPCNELQTSHYLSHLRSSFYSLFSLFPSVAPFLSLEIIQGDELRDRGFGGIYGVGKAASQPPALAILKYEPEGAEKNIAWVGKGIVYDTGGLSIKSDMTTMKIDMGGSAAILGAFLSAVQLNFSHNLYALLCLAENSVSELATRPDDIHTLYSGKTVEINNTDAEGRLVLADGVAYATKHLNPDYLVDMCTLTGAQGIATGRRHAAIVTNNDEIERAAVLAGRYSGDLVHPLLYCPEFFNVEFASKVADMKNSVATRNNASSSCAAQFIANNFVNYKNSWLHVDMAAPAARGERATAYGVALLLQLFVLEGLPPSPSL